jgi:hypothetical protein
MLFLLHQIVVLFQEILLGFIYVISSSPTCCSFSEDLAPGAGDGSGSNTRKTGRGKAKKKSIFRTLKNFEKKYKTLKSFF